MGLMIFINLGLFLCCVPISWAQTTDDTCVNNNLTPRDEDEESSAFLLFAENLDKITGLASEPWVLTDLECASTTCSINPNGTAIWDARLAFYSSKMKANVDEAEKKNTLDGCLCYSTDNAEYQTCMTDLRTKMTEELETVLLPLFRELVQSNSCALLSENCI